ncbi:MAG: hypothetical protein HXS53_12875, partial [Theionarchaea archaeon]|nr:hypothetical protein [Theionarchaea archaeon]
MKGKIGVVTVLTALLVLSAAASGLQNSLTIHVRVAGEKNDLAVFQLEKISEDKTTLTAKIADVDMAIFQYHFAIAKVAKHIDLRIIEVGPGYYVVTIPKNKLKPIGLNDYVLKLPGSFLKKSMSTAFSSYEGAELLDVNVFANNKYMRTFVANMGVDIAHVDLEGGYMRILASYEDLLALELAGFDVEVTCNLSDIGTFQLEPEYYTYPEVVNELPQIQSDHSAIAKTFSLGTSYEGRDIPGIKISDNVGTNESEPEVFICAMHHAREAATLNVAMYIINYLTDNYGSNSAVTNAVNNLEIYIIPVVNPDGKVYDDSGGSYGSGRSWRKNRQPCSGGIGTDLNRNYSYQWGGSGSSGTCTSDTFRGYSAFDAPESAAVRDFVLAHPDITILFTYHSYGDLVLWPWGYTYNAISDADDRQVHEIIGQNYAGYVGYTPQQASDLYLASGTTDDWSYGVTQNDAMPIFSFTVELDGGGFYPPPSALPTMCANNTAGMMYVLGVADNPYQVLPQPEPLTITSPSNGQTVSGTVNITCDAEPEIVKVEFYIDGSLKSTDTASPFSYSWDTTAYSDSSHTILVKGYDSGNSFVDDDTINVTVD